MRRIAERLCILCTLIPSSCTWKHLTERLNLEKLKQTLYNSKSFSVCYVFNCVYVLVLYTSAAALQFSPVFLSLSLGTGFVYAPHGVKSTTWALNQYLYSYTNPKSNYWNTTHLKTHLYHHIICNKFMVYLHIDIHSVSLYGFRIKNILFTSMQLDAVPICHLVRIRFVCVKHCRFLTASCSSYYYFFLLEKFQIYVYTVNIRKI